MMERITGGLKAAAFVGALILSQLPFPVAMAAGEIGQAALEGHVGPELKMLQKYLGYVAIGAVVATIGKVAISAMVTAVKYVWKHGLFGAVRNLWSSAVSLAKRAWNWRERKRHIPGTCGCFSARTLVWTLAGLVPIDQVKIGDYVVARDDQTGLVQFAPVEATMETPGAALLTVAVRHADGRIEVIETTDEHPFWVEGRSPPGAGAALTPGDAGEAAVVPDAAPTTTAPPTLWKGTWRRADELSPGHRVGTLLGHATVLAVTFTSDRQSVFNLTVKDIGTFHVGDDGVLVHNCTWAQAKLAYWNSLGLAGPPVAHITVRVKKTGAIEKRVVVKEVHHIDGRAVPNPHDSSNLVDLWPWQHEVVDPNRYTGYTLISVDRVSMPLLQR